MCSIFSAISIIFVIISIKLYKKKINPISIYLYIWLISVIGYELKLVHYYDLSFLTWAAIFNFCFFYIFGCYISYISYDKKDFDIKFFAKKKVISDLMVKQKIKKIIIFLSCLSAIGILSAIYNVYVKYGIDMFIMVNSIYHDRLSNDEQFSSIPYIGKLLYLAIILCGYYIKKYGFQKFIFIPIIISCLTSFTGGGRSSIVTLLILAIF